MPQIDLINSRPSYSKVRAVQIDAQQHRAFGHYRELHATAGDIFRTFQVPNSEVFD